MMKKTRLFNKKAIIVVPIVLALILGSVGTIGLMAFEQTGNNPQPIELSEEEIAKLIQEQFEELKKSIDDETVLKIIDIHENINDYLDTTHTLETQFFEFEDGYSVGIEYFFDSEESLLFDIPADFSNVDLPEDIHEYDWVKVSGKIGTTEEVDNDHTHTVPVIHITSIEKIDK
ncbi:hypothetical protein DW1_1598 [Proteiniborus sp. DW1]|nr:hypothetical protein DW1_1598 [Proteiniborus sp. DW1]